MFLIGFIYARPLPSKLTWNRVICHPVFKSAESDLLFDDFMMCCPCILQALLQPGSIHYAMRGVPVGSIAEGNLI